MKILAIDQSLNASGICVLDDFRPVLLTTLKSEKLRGMDRLTMIMDKMKELIVLHSPEVVVMEEYARQVRNSAALIPLVELGGCLKMMAFEQGYKFGTLADMKTSTKFFHVQNVTSMKKFMLGDGSTGKDPRYLLKVYERLKISFVDDNQADAYMHAAMAHFTHSIICGETQISGLLKYQQEALIEAKAKRSRGLSIAKALKMPEEEKYQMMLAA